MSVAKKASQSRLKRCFHQPVRLAAMTRAISPLMAPRGRRDKLEYLPTIPFFLERFFHSTDLPPNPAHPVDELLLVPDSMSHQKIKYTPGGYAQSTIE